MTHYQIFGNIGHSSSDPSPKIKANVLHLFSLYSWELNFGQTLWNKSEVLLGTSWELGEPYKNKMRTHWEPQKIKNQKSKIALTVIGTNIGPLSCAYWAFSLVAWNFFILKTVCHRFWPGLLLLLMAGGTNCG